MDDPQKTGIKINFPLKGNPAPQSPDDYGASDAPEHEKLMQIKDALESGDVESALAIVNECLNENPSEDQGEPGMPADLGSGRVIKFPKGALTNA